jgi:hypothetical protein
LQTKKRKQRKRKKTISSLSSWWVNSFPTNPSPEHWFHFVVLVFFLIFFKAQTGEPKGIVSFVDLAQG